MSLTAFILPLTAYASNTIWSNSAVPTTASVSDSSALELGVKFRSDVNGYITGLRFYKGSTNTGTHVGHLWTATGQLLASATFSSETASGWQQVTLATPVAITANTVYVASYYAPHGNFALSRPYFTKSYDNPPLHALADGTSGPNGVYFYPGSGFPKSTYQQSNYWVDVVFKTTASVSTSPSPTATSTLAVSGVSPSSGSTAGGNVVTITGSNFQSGATVNFGGTNSTAVTLISATQINAMTPSHTAGTVNLTVSNTGGSSASKSSCYTYSNAPGISSISPNAGPVAGGTSVTIIGTGFQSGAIVSFGAVLASATVINSTQIQAVTPAEAAGTVNVTVQNPNGSRVTSNSAFSFFASTSAPSISSISPNSNVSTGGATATIIGSNFSYGATVTFGSTAASLVTLVSPSQLRVVVPPGSPATTVNVAVTNPNGQKATLTSGFHYGKVLFQDGFESGNFSAWSTVWTTTDNVVQSSHVHSGSRAARIYYSLAASATGTNRDNNRSFSKYFNSGTGFPAGLTHFFVRGYVYFQTPLIGAGVDAQRKLYFAKNKPDAYNWSYVLRTANMQLVFAPQPALDSAYLPTDYNISWNLADLQQNTWYSIEMETQLNTPCKHDGYLNVWVNGKQVLHLSNWNIRGCFTDGLGDFEVGNQLDTAATAAISEYRYWDDVVFADAYIGP